MTRAFAARTLSLSTIGGARSAAERDAWWRGFIAGLLLALSVVVVAVIACFGIIVRAH
jgi:hypothetical protein